MDLKTKGMFGHRKPRFPKGTQKLTSTVSNIASTTEQKPRTMVYAFSRELIEGAQEASDKAKAKTKAQAEIKQAPSPVEKKPKQRNIFWEFLIEAFTKEL